MLNEEQPSKKVEVVPLSNNTTACWIHDLAADVKKELVFQLQLSDAYSLVLDESIDMLGLVALLVFIHYMFDKFT
jgi:uncharacterized membrane-anchored protein